MFIICLVFEFSGRSVQSNKSIRQVSTLSRHMNFVEVLVGLGQSCPFLQNIEVSVNQKVIFMSKRLEPCIFVRIHVIVKSVIQGPGVPLCIGRFMMVRERQQGRVRKTQFCARVMVECLQE